ncbi:MAG: carbohydrate transporter permease [Clostridia bacterium]|jgi:multiple sugar transport system permease protein|nr:carbohydrate transporter permease [Clostridia bacterium]
MQTSFRINHDVRKQSKSASLKLDQWLIYSIMACITVIVFLPMLVVLFASFKTAPQIGNDFPLQLPSLTNLNLENYMVVFTKGKILLGFKNSIFLVVISVAVNALLGTMTTYCLHRFDFKFKKTLIALFALGMVIPGQICEIARFSIMSRIGVYNTIWAPVIIYAAADLMQLYIYMQFIDKIPVSLDESAMIDGATYFQIFYKIIFPLLKPATATLAIIKAVEVMNDMYIPYLYMPSAKLRTVTTTLMSFSSSQFSAWEYLSAAIVVVMVPTILIYIVFQKYIFAGIVAGAVKE